MSIPSPTTRPYPSPPSPDFSDGREGVYVGGLGNTQKAVDETAERLGTALGISEVIGVTALDAFKHPDDLKRLVDGSDGTGTSPDEGESRHLISTSAGTAAVVHAGIENPASVSFYEPTQKTKWWKLPPKLVRLLASQSRKGWRPDPNYSGWREEQPLYRESVKMKLKELTGWPFNSVERLKKAPTYIRLLGKIASANTQDFLVQTRQRGIPSRIVVGEQNEMRLNPPKPELNRLMSLGVAVRVQLGARADHERIALVPEDIALKFLR